MVLSGLTMVSIWFWKREIDSLKWLPGVASRRVIEPPQRIFSYECLNLKIVGDGSLLDGDDFFG